MRECEASAISWNFDCIYATAFTRFSSARDFLEILSISCSFSTLLKKILHNLDGGSDRFLISGHHDDEGKNELKTITHTRTLTAQMKASRDI